ncbi:hypothetical protein Vretimale_15733 [Volvox reticuliferus]|uniref:Uncharacterized protein n=1 Tax=Volvox reticuliferus TaxID=1737510 RepID=A0A8J4D2Q2_9CHLO|nr:hypothetical protein Vretifemale_18355 [Volvox reticuliferus]GIM12399.1 hypothetical protein Vretimale_15733 [Volvox reticuliferus]
MLYNMQHRHASCFKPGHRYLETHLAWNKYAPRTLRDIERDSYLVARRETRYNGTLSSSTGLRPPAALAQQGDSLERPIGAMSSSPPQSLTWMTCRRCKQRFAAEHNHREACRYHSEGWTGGELAKVTRGQRT